MMNVLLLGGTGHVGKLTLDLLKKHASNHSITVTGTNERKMNKLVEKYGDGIKPVLIDINKRDAVINLMKQHDLVVSTIGPYYKYATQLIQDAISAKVNFIDIDDDYDATKNSLDLDEDAKKAGVSVVIGCGATPGMSNIMAKAGADKLDKVDDIRIYWTQSGTGAAGTAAIVHWFHITSDEVPMYIDGKWVNVKGFSEPEWVEFPGGLGRQETLYTGHAEPISLPRYIKGLKNVTIKGSVFPPSMLNIYKSLNCVGFGSKNDLAISETLSVPIREIVVKLIRSMARLNPEFFKKLYEEEKANYNGLAGANMVVVTGEKNGKKAKYRYEGTATDVNLSTAAPFVAGTLMMLGGEVKTHGVFSVEGAFKPTKFFEVVAKIDAGGYLTESFEERIITE